MAGRNANGEGTIYRRKDGRYEGAIYLLTASGHRKRYSVYGRTREEAHARLVVVKANAQQGRRLPDRVWNLSDYFDYWLEQVVRPNLRPRTYESYAQRVRLNLRPGLGRHKLSDLTVRTVQVFFNEQLAAGRSVRLVRMIREVLSSALARAEREELVARNVARLVSLPGYERKDIRPWSQDEAQAFLKASRDDPLHSAFVLLTVYGLRLGEVLGIRWGDFDNHAGILRVRQQLQRVEGELRQVPVKTHASNRDLPVTTVVREALIHQQERQEQARQSAGSVWRGAGGNEELVFTTRTGLPIEPRNFARSFHRITRTYGLRDIKVHHVRHTAATLFKKLGVPARDAQLILGHSQITTTQQIYQHGDIESRIEALEKVNRLFMRSTSLSVAVKECRQAAPVPDWIRSIHLEPTEGFEPTTRCLQRSLGERFKAVALLLEDRRRTRLVGLVAVNACRQQIN